MEKFNDKLVFYTEDGKTVHGICVQVGSSYYILHKDKEFPGSAHLSYEPWIARFGTQYTRYSSNPIAKNVKIATETYELWD